MEPEFLNQLEHSWSAEIRMRNNIVINIWYTAWPSSKDNVKEIVSVSSDYPMHVIRKNVCDSCGISK